MTQEIDNLEREAAYMKQLLAAMASKGGSDLFISADFPPSMKANGEMTPLAQNPLSPEQSRRLCLSIMNERQRKEFLEELECNFAIAVPAAGRFRVNVFVQQGATGMVVRTIASEIPSFDKMRLPPILKDVVMTKRGLVLLVGGTGSGKSTTLAAMVDHRNANSGGHIITIEDPVEYAHKSKRSLVTHREVGVDTLSWKHALKNTLRQAPDVILIGEIRDEDTMEKAVEFAETGHLCMSTLHANSANQAFERIVNFFPEERRQALLNGLSLNVKAIISQRLVRTKDGKGRRAAIEILINTPTIADLIAKGEFGSIKAAMAKSREQGMQTFDQALYDLYMEGSIDIDEAVRNADSANEVRLMIKLNGSKAASSASDAEAIFGGGGLSIMEETLPEKKEDGSH